MARAKADCEERSRRWTDWVSKWQGSGLSQAAFCRGHGLNGNTFNYWKLRVLKQRSDEKCFRQKVEFTPVRVTDTAACTYEVCLRGGRRIRIGSNFDEASLRRLIGVLDGATGAC